MSEFLDVAIKDWVRADEALSNAEIAYKKREAQLSLAVLEARNAADKARKTVEEMLAETGEYEVLVDNVKVSWSTPRESVKISDPLAVPDEYCKIERKPKLTEIKKYLESNKVNWASMESGEAKLQWRYTKEKNNDE